MKAEPAPGGVTDTTTDRGLALLETVRAMRGAFVDLVSRMARHESPTDRPETQAGVQTHLVTALRELGFRTHLLAGRETGGHLFARPEDRAHDAPFQLLVGHTDTVWPVGTLDEMPVRIEGDRLCGPGTLDMKGGLAQIVIALRALERLELRPEVTPVVFVNSDEETGSPESARWVRRLARHAERAYVLEPALGPHGSIKTERKGVGRFEIFIRGRASHAGLDPDAGVSAILELAHVVQELHGLSDPARGTTVNVGVVAGGLRANMVAPKARGSIDVRARTMADAEEVQAAILGIRPRLSGTEIEVRGGFVIPPLERTPRNRRLWHAAREAGADLGFALTEGSAGGGSDGNTTSQLTATLDGLGCIGDGAHAAHEHIEIGPSLDRCALLAQLMLLPASS